MHHLLDVFDRHAEARAAFHRGGDHLAAERARHVGELDEARQRYQTLFNRNPFPAWVYDLETLRLVAMNDAMVADYRAIVERLLAEGR